jgi:hypothetical protein
MRDGGVGWNGQKEKERERERYREISSKLDVIITSITCGGMQNNFLSFPLLHPFPPFLSPLCSYSLLVSPVPPFSVFLDSMTQGLRVRSGRILSVRPCPSVCLLPAIRHTTQHTAYHTIIRYVRHEREC